MRKAWVELYLEDTCAAGAMAVSRKKIAGWTEQKERYITAVLVYPSHAKVGKNYKLNQKVVLTNQALSRLRTARSLDIEEAKNMVCNARGAKNLEGSPCQVEEKCSVGRSTCV